MVKFNRLDVPHQWKDEYTKYPHGYTIFEALCSWTTQMNNVIDYVNGLMTTTLQPLLREALDEMAVSGELGRLIQELIIIDGGEF